MIQNHYLEMSVFALVFVSIIQTAIYIFFSVTNGRKIDKKLMKDISNEMYKDRIKTVENENEKLLSVIDSYKNNTVDAVRGFLLSDGAQYTITSFHLNHLKRMNSNYIYRSYDVNNELEYSGASPIQYKDRDGLLRDIAIGEIVVFVDHIGDGTCLLKIKGELIIFPCSLLDTKFKKFKKLVK